MPFSSPFRPAVLLSEGSPPVTTPAPRNDGRHDTLATLGRDGARVSLAILLSRITGFVRDMLIAQRFGTGPMADLFYVAYRIPNMLRELFAEGALSSAFIPTLTQTLTNEGREEAERLYAGVFLLLSAILIPVVLLGMILAPEILALLAPGWTIDPKREAIGVLMTRIMFPFLYFISLSALLMGVLNAQKRFFLPAVSPVAFSLLLITATLVPGSLFSFPPIVLLAVGVLLGGVAQWGIVLALSPHQRLRLRPHPNMALAWKNGRVRSVFKKVLPAIGGLWVTQGNLLVATLMGSYLTTGTIAALYYAMRLVQFPLGLIGAAVATVILPLLSMHAKEGEGPQEKLVETLAHGYRASLYLMLPASAGLVALREPLIDLLFRHGHFDEKSASLTATALLGYAVGLWSFSGVRIVVRAFYALGDMTAPVRAALAGLVTNLAISLLFARSQGIVALALGISAGSIVNQIWLLALLKRKIGRFPGEVFKGAPLFLLHSVLMYVAVRFLWNWLSPGISPQKTVLLAGTVAGLILAGGGLYGGLTWLSGISETRLLVGRILRGLQRKKR